MPQSVTRRVVLRLTEEQPSYQQLIELYGSLQTMSGEDAPEDVGLVALAHVIGEFIDYLDLVSEEFEKSVGLTRASERKRILQEFNTPNGDDVEQVASIIDQWRKIDRYSREKIGRMVQQQFHN